MAMEVAVSALALPVPQTDELPQTALLPQTAELPHTAEVPQAAEEPAAVCKRQIEPVPQTALFAHIEVELHTIVAVAPDVHLTTGDIAVPENAVLSASAAAISR